MLRSPAGASAATQCYLDSAVADYWTFEFQYKGFYRASGKCYYDSSTQVYNNCENNKHFSECNAGYYINQSVSMGPGFTNSCTPCSPGTYTTQVGNIGGQAPGQDGSYTYATSCTACSPGTYNSATAATGCSSCPSGYTSATGATSQSGCYMNVPAGKYVKTANDSSASTCSAGYWNPAHTVYYGKTSNCNQCTGATYSDTAGASSCKQCPTAIEHVGLVTDYWYWSSNGVHDMVYGCRASFSEYTTTGSYAYSCGYCGGDYGVNDGCGDDWCTNVIDGTVCAASYYNPNGNNQIWAASAADLKSNLCVSVGVGNWSESGATAPTQCPAGYRDGPAATSQSGCAKNCINQSIAGGTNVPVSGTVNYPNSCEYTTVCNDGYNQSSDGVCSQLCGLGFTTLRTGTGLVIPLYSEKLSSPAIHIGYNGGMCYGILESGSGNGINLEFGDQTYHTGR